MVSKIDLLKHRCSFCKKELESKYSKCFNIYCQGQKFNKGNLVIYRLNPDLGLGRIIKVIEIPTSKSLDDEDTSFFSKYKVLFKNKIVKIIHPIDLVHFIFEVNEKIETKFGIGIINSQDFLVQDGKYLKFMNLKCILSIYLISIYKFHNEHSIPQDSS